MLAFANVMHFFPHELAGLRCRRFALPRVAACAFHRSLLRHWFLPLIRGSERIDA